MPFYFLRYYLNVYFYLTHITRGGTARALGSSAKYQVPSTWGAEKKKGDP